VKQLTGMLCGHPYLIRRALYLLATQRIPIEKLFLQAADDYGPFGDHLRYHLFELRNKERLINELKHILLHGKSQDVIASHLLRGAGLVRGENKNINLSCPLYEEFFRRHLND
jgi:hypothetical protein